MSGGSSYTTFTSLMVISESRANDKGEQDNLRTLCGEHRLPSKMYSCHARDWIREFKGKSNGEKWIMQVLITERAGKALRPGGSMLLRA
jgi:hypothetical protein